MYSPTYLFRDKSGIYYFRYAVPQTARKLDPELPREIKISVKTKRKMLALGRAKYLWLKTQQLIRSDCQGTFRGMEKGLSIGELIRRYRDYIASAEEYVQDSVYWGQSGYVEYVEPELEYELRLLKKWDLLQFLDTSHFGNLPELVKRAKEAEQESQNHNIKATISQKLRHSQSFQNVSVSSRSIEHERITVSRLFDKYAEKKYQDDVWKPNTYRSNKERVEFLIQVIGDKDIGQINKTDVRAFLDALKQKKNKKNEIINKVTHNQYISTCRAMFDYGKSLYDQIDENLFDNPNLKLHVNEHDISKRVPWSLDELREMFNHPIFTEGGRIILHPYYYWLPILGLCTGARLNELCSLHMDDVRREGNIHYIDINLDQPEKSIKTGRSRSIPIHKTVIDLGFMEMVELMRDPKYQFIDSHGYKRLWRGTSFDKNKNTYKNYPSKWFGNPELNARGKQKGFKYQFGFNFPSDNKKDFHSFRHTFKTVCQQQGMIDGVNRDITGHSYGTTAHDSYLHGHTLEQINDEIQKIDFSKYLGNVKPFFSLVNKNLMKEVIKTKTNK